VVTVDRIGLSIGRDTLRALVVRRSAVLWRGEAAVRDPNSLAGEIAALLGKVPRSRWHQREVIAVIGPAAAQVKRITGLPENAADRELTEAVRLNAARFFLRNGSPLMTSSVTQRGNERWCAAFHASVVAALTDACERERVRLRGCVPSATTLGCGLADGRVVWIDGETVEEVTLRRGECARVRRLAAGERAAPALRAPLRALGADAARFADAYGAAVLGSRSQFLVDPGAALRGNRRRMVVRAALATLLLFTSAAAISAPAIHATLRERAAVARLNALGPQSSSTLSAMRELSGATQSVRRIEEFASSRRSMTMLLGSLSQVLPESTAIVSLRVDSVGGTLVGLTQVGNTILPEVSRVAGVVSAELTGAVTREVVAGVPMQRFVSVFRFVRPRATRVASSASGAR
jgi:hypothetical protein